MLHNQGRMVPATFNIPIPRRFQSSSTEGM